LYPCRPVQVQDELFSWNSLIEIMPNGTLTLQNLTVSEGNLPNNPGGAIYSTGILSLDNVTVANNLGAPGGAIFQQDGNLTLHNSMFESNRTPSSVTSHYKANGGAIYLINTTASIIDTKFYNNRTQYPQYWSVYGGGAIRAYVTHLRIEGSEFKDNYATSGHGGAIYIENDYEEGYEVLIDSSVFDGNSAYSSGGAVNTRETLTRITNSLFSNNRSFSSSGGGGAVSVNQPTMNNSIFVGNRAYYNSAIALTGGHTLSHLTVVDNHASSTYGGAVDNHRGTFSHSIFFNNTGGRGNCDSKFGETGGYNISDDDSCTFSFDDSTDINNAEFELYPLGYYGYSRQSIIPKSSNLIDAIPAEACGAPEDYYGSTRPQGGICDIGAVEVTGTEIYPPYDLHITEGAFGDIWTMSWENNIIPDAYEIEHVVQLLSGTSNGEIININGAIVNYPINTGTLICDAIHNHHIRSVRNSDGRYSDWSNLAYFYLPCELAPRPSNVSGVPTSPTSLQFSWDPVIILVPISSVSGTTEWIEQPQPVNIEQFDTDTASWYMRASYIYGESIVLNGYECNQSYQFRLQVDNFPHISDYSDIVQVDMDPCPLFVPTDLAYTIDLYDDVILTWTDTNIYEDNYIVERSTNGGSSWNLLTTLPLDSITYTDQTTIGETSYVYRIRSYNVMQNEYSVGATINV
jgi:predicted outer membrane repeat protein